MSKKKKSKDGPKPLIKRKHKRLFFRVLIAGTLALSAYTLFNPEIIKNQAAKEKVYGARQALVSISEQSQQQVEEKLPQIQQLTSIKERIPQEIVLGDQDIVVEEAIKQVTQNIEHLPAKQLERFRTDFCADLIKQAINACEASQSATPN